ncbi:MAG: tyrosine-type recombinase/integrase [Candidatus Woesearchaeota archaeon]|nr:MAG: tyrosine-type recombinase/integrase [Candidatus Woesearchaeota archaeon]
MEINYLIQREGLRRGLSPRTTTTYCKCVEQFFKQCHKGPKEVTKKDIREYIDKLVDKKRAGNTINVYLNSLKFFFEEVLKRNMQLKIKYSKVPKTLPIVLTQEETKKLFEAIKNEKHKLMVELMYSAGLRVSELVNLKVKDLELDNNYGWVRNGKGGKDRMFVIAEKIKNRLIEYIKNLNYEEHLFSGHRTPISRRTLQVIIKDAAKKARINKKVHPHTLRHSFATHLIENGCDISSVQSLLGHNSIQTTMTYLHTASNKMIKVKSPFDIL